MSSTEFTTLTVAVPAPMAMASVNNASTVDPNALAYMRAAYLRSSISIRVALSIHRDQLGVELFDIGKDYGAVFTEFSLIRFECDGGVEIGERGLEAPGFVMEHSTASERVPKSRIRDSAAL